MRSSTRCLLVASGSSLEEMSGENVEEGCSVTWKLKHCSAKEELCGKGGAQ